MVEDRHVVLPIRGHKHPEARTGHIMSDPVPQLLQDRHQVVPSDETGMNEQEMVLLLGQGLGDAGTGLRRQLQQVLPVLARRIGPVRLLDDGAIDFEFLGFLMQGVKEQVVKRNPLEIKPSPEFFLGPAHAAGTHGEDEEPAIGVGVLQTFVEGPCLGLLRRDVEIAAGFVPIRAEITASITTRYMSWR